MSTGTAGVGANPPQVGTGGATSPGTAGVGAGPTTGGFATAGTFGIAGFSAAGFGNTGGVSVGGAGGVNVGGVSVGGSVAYPPQTCPSQPPPNGTSCAAYHADPGFHCYYDAPACRVVSTCLASDKWRSECEAPGTGGEAGTPGEAGAGGI